MSDYQSPLNPENSPNEKLIVQRRFRQERRVKDYLRAQGVDSDLAERIGTALDHWDEDSKFERQQELVELESWANIHTHSGGTSGGSPQLDIQSWEFLGGGGSYANSLIAKGNKIHGAAVSGSFDAYIDWYDADLDVINTSLVFSGGGGHFFWHTADFFYVADTRLGTGSRYIVRWNHTIGQDGRHLLPSNDIAIAACMNDILYFSNPDDPGRLGVSDNINDNWLGDDSEFSSVNLDQYFNGRPREAWTTIISNTPDGIYFIGDSLGRNVFHLNNNEVLSDLGPLPLFPDEPVEFNSFSFQNRPGGVYYNGSIYFGGGSIRDSGTGDNFELGVYRFDISNWSMEQLPEPGTFRNSTAYNSAGVMGDSLYLANQTGWWRSLP